jgi:hypothetical protein
MDYPPDARATVLDLLKDPWLTKNNTEPIKRFTEEEKKSPESTTRTNSKKSSSL